jgi:hypothetical protein
MQKETDDVYGKISDKVLSFETRLKTSEAAVLHRQAGLIATKKGKRHRNHIR